MSEIENFVNHTSTNEPTTLNPSLSTDTKTAYVEFRKVYELAEIAVPLAVTAAFVIVLCSTVVYVKVRKRRYHNDHPHRMPNISGGVPMSVAAYQNHSFQGHSSVIDLPPFYDSSNPHLYQPAPPDYSEAPPSYEDIMKHGYSATLGQQSQTEILQVPVTVTNRQVNTSNINCNVIQQQNNTHSVPIEDSLLEESHDVSHDTSITTSNDQNCSTDSESMRVRSDHPNAHQLSYSINTSSQSEGGMSNQGFSND